jgi:hypothetical protein
MLSAGDLRTTQADAAAATALTSSPTTTTYAEWFSRNPTALIYPLPKIKAVQELQSIAADIFQTLDKLTRRSHFPETRSSFQIHWDRLTEIDNKILEIWGTTLEEGWNRYQAQEAVPQESPWWSCLCCCCSEDTTEEAKENLDQSYKLFTSDLSKLRTELHVKEAEE